MCTTSFITHTPFIASPFLQVNPNRLSSGGMPGMGMQAMGMAQMQPMQQMQPMGFQQQDGFGVLVLSGMGWVCQWGIPTICMGKAMINLHFFGYCQTMSDTPIWNL